MLSIKTEKIINNLKKLEYIFDFSDLDEKFDIIKNKNKKIVGKFKLKTPIKVWIDDCVYLRIKKFIRIYVEMIIKINSRLFLTLSRSM